MTLDARFGSRGAPSLDDLQATRDRVEGLVAPVLEQLSPAERMPLQLAVTSLDFTLYVYEQRPSDEDIREAIARLAESRGRPITPGIGLDDHVPYADAAMMAGEDLRFSRPAVGDIIDFIIKVITGASNPKPKK